MKEQREMSENAIRGCQEGKMTPKYYEVRCPKCGGCIEVFVHMGGSADKTGRTVYEERCEACGKRIPQGTPITSLKQL